jgi:hypothetical protein
MLQVEFLKFFRSGSSFVQCPRTVHIKHQLDLCASLFARSVNSRKLYFMKLQTAKSIVDRPPNTGANN